MINDYSEMNAYQYLVSLGDDIYVLDTLIYKLNGIRSTQGKSTLSLNYCALINLHLSNLSNMEINHKQNNGQLDNPIYMSKNDMAFELTLDTVYSQLNMASIDNEIIDVIMQHIANGLIHLSYGLDEIAHENSSLPLSYHYKAIRRVDDGDLFELRPLQPGEWLDEVDNIIDRY